MPLSAKPCPPAVVAFVRQRLEDIATAESRDERPWYLKWFIGRGIRSEPPEFVQVRQLSECNVQEKTCGGQLIGNWLVSGTEVITHSLEEDSTTEFFKKKLIELARVVVVNFAFALNADVCVINEVDLKGSVKREAFALPDGIKSNLFGTTFK